MRRAPANRPRRRSRSRGGNLNHTLLNAAGWTYVAAAIAAIGRPLYYVLLLTGGSRRDYNMKQHGVKRLIISAGAGVGDPGDAPKLFNKLINVALKATARNVYEDMLKTVALVRESGLEWTVVRVPRLTDTPRTGNVRVGMVGKGTGANLSRADMAEFMLKQVDDLHHLRKAPVISN